MDRVAFRQIQGAEKRLVLENPASQDQAAHVAAPQPQRGQGHHDIMGEDRSVFPRGL